MLAPASALRHVALEGAVDLHQAFGARTSTVIRPGRRQSLKDDIGGGAGIAVGLGGVTGTGFSSVTDATLTSGLVASPGFNATSAL